MFTSILQRILNAILANGQKQDLTNEKLDHIIVLLTPTGPTHLTVKLGPPTKR